MSGQLLYNLLIIFGLINLLHFGLYIIGANIYDIKQLYKSHLKRPRRRRNPLVSVVIPAHNEGLSIERCLDSVRRSSYRKLQIIVVDDASSDDTRKIVWNYIYKKYPSHNIRLLRKVKNVGKGRALNHAIRRGATGELIMALDADSILHRDAIRNAVAYFDDPRIVGLAANVRVIGSRSVLGTLQMFEHIIGYRSKKFYTLSNSEFIAGGVASTYRTDILKKVRFYDTDTMTEDIGLSMKIISQSGNKDSRIVYASDVVAMTEGVQTYKALFRQRYRWKMGGLQNLLKYRSMIGSLNSKYSRLLTIYRLPMAIFSEATLLIQPLLIGYLVYLAVHFHTPMVFSGAYLIITVFVLIMLWPDEYIPMRRKLRLSCVAPFMYFIFYIMDFVQTVSVIRCLLNVKQLRRIGVDGTWVSPERTGQREVQFS